MMRMDVYVKDDCWTCEETHRIVADVAPHFPEVEVQLLNLEEVPRPEEVFAVPTYMLNGRVIFLGNPIRDELCQKLIDAQNKFTSK